MINVELTEQDALLFRQFMEHRDKFQLLLDNGVFNIRNGSALLNFSPIGDLTQIDINVLMYKKGYPQVVTVLKL